MSVTINGSGTITGISAGGLPDGVVTAADLAAGAARANFGAGAVLQVVSTYSDTMASYANGSTITPLSISITPSSTSSKILIMVNMGMAGADSAADIGVEVQRNGTGIQLGGGSGIDATFATQTNVDSTHGGSVGFSLIDSPSSTSSVAYTFVARPNSPRTLYLNRRGNDEAVTTGSNVILMEIAA